MTLDQAREWASRHDHIRDVFHPDAKAAIEVIQSLPDKWVDADKLRELINRREKTPPSSSQERDFVRKLYELIHGIETLPTLADMTQEEREACQWMQAKVLGFGEDELLVISKIGDGWAKLWLEDGSASTAGNACITPLPDLLKLEWPGSGDAPTIAQKERVADDQAVAKDVCNSEPNSSETPKSSIKSEDVPGNELWLVRVREESWVGRRSRKSRDYPWYIASPNGGGAEISQDSEITLIHKLVPETHTLPEGMRLANHEEYGRIIVSPRTDLHGDYLVEHSDDDSEYGSDWAYLNEGEFTYLDGETK